MSYRGKPKGVHGNHQRHSSVKSFLPSHKKVHSDPDTRSYNADINGSLERAWLAGLDHVDESISEHIIIQEASESDFGALGITESELRAQEHYSGRILALRDQQNNYTYSLIKADEK